MCEKFWTLSKLLFQPQLVLQPQLLANPLPQDRVRRAIGGFFLAFSVSVSTLMTMLLALLNFGLRE